MSDALQSIAVLVMVPHRAHAQIHLLSRRHRSSSAELSRVLPCFISFIQKVKCFMTQAPTA